MSIKWTMEAVVAVIAMAGTASISLYNSIYHSGASAQKVVQLETHQQEQDNQLAGHEVRIRAQETNAAAEQQSLKDIKDQLDRMEKKL